MKRTTLLLTLAVSFLLAGVVLASDGNYELTWNTVDDGGGMSTGGAYELGGTVGQADAETLSGGSYTLAGGFWGGAVLQRNLYLPLIMKRYVIWVPDTPTPTLTATPSRTPTPTSTSTPTPTPWCDPYEPNNDRYTNPWGPLTSAQSYQAKLCAGDPEDNYFFDVTTTNPVQLHLQLPGSLVNHTSIWLYAQSNLGQTICGTGPVTTADYTTICPISQTGTGRYIIRLYTDGAADDANPYTLQVTFQ